jgi:DNA-binding IclR family transcriptional regulator
VLKSDAAVPVKSADRALAIVEFVASKGTATFTEILEALSLPRSSAFGLLNTLVNSGWLDHDVRTKRYTLGLRAWQVGQMYSGHRDLAHLAKPVMDRLVGQLGETVQLARLEGIENVYIAISESPQPMRLASSVGMRLHAHATGIGKALLSMIDAEDSRTRLSSVALPRLTERTVTDVDQLEGLIDEARRRGYAIDDEEFVSGCRCVAVPLLVSKDGDVVTAMSVTMPTSRTTGDWPANILGPLRDAAEEIRAIISARSAN